MATPPHITIISVITDVSATTRPAIAALLAQVWAHWHHYVIVTRSAAADWATIEARYTTRYQGRLTVHRVAGTPSLADALARVQVTTPYAAVLTPDATWHPAFLHTCITQLEAAPDAAAAVTHTGYVKVRQSHGKALIDAEGGYNPYLRRIPAKALVHPVPFPLAAVVMRSDVLPHAATNPDDSLALWRFYAESMSRDRWLGIDQVLCHWHGDGTDPPANAALIPQMAAAARDLYMRHALPELHYLALYFDAADAFPAMLYDGQRYAATARTAAWRHRPGLRTLRGLYHLLVPTSIRLLLRDQRLRLLNHVKN